MKPKGPLASDAGAATKSRSIEDVKQSTYGVQTESRLAYSGLKEGAEHRGGLEKYTWLYNPKTDQEAQQADRAESYPLN